MASSMLFEDLILDFSCPVCLEWFRKPVILPCGHLYCQACVEMLCGVPGSKPVCPQCRKEFPERGYTPCKLLGTLIDRLRRMSPGKAEKEQHSKAICEEPCVAENHTVPTTQQATEWYKEELSLAVSQLESNLTKLVMHRSNEEERLQNQQAVTLSLGDDITIKFRQLHRFLYTCEEKWKARLEEEGGSLLQETEGRLRLLKNTFQGAQDLLLEAQGHLQLQDSAKFLKDIHSLLNRVQQQSVTSPVPDMRPMLQILGQLKGPIQYITWREMKSSLGIEFPQITLDSKTAHPCLVLSDDITCVWDGQLRQDVPDTPVRFDYCVAVLGCQGFNAGKHYWEVEVGDKLSWSLGLVNISINRKGKITASPGNGYWVIRLWNGAELIAKDTPPQRLFPSSFPKRVGVYLDYEAGLVSFYDAFIMVHLYTFVTSRFKEMLVPYFCPGLHNSGKNGAPLKISHLPYL